jgi:formate hydrogenlyase subunit 3/multisubunit Na+/H+ antiporter MnhD subunit
MPVNFGNLPNLIVLQLLLFIFLEQVKSKTMRNKDYFMDKHREHHPRVSFGLFLIVLGVALLVATNDMLHLGGVGDYFTWQSLLIFIGVLLILNLQFTGGIVLLAIGSWFMIEHLDYKLPEIVKTIYWPAVIILIGLGFIFSSFLRHKDKNN